MEKFRVGFVLLLSEQWLGGLNYYRNLLRIISHDPELEIVVFVPTDMNRDLLKDFPAVQYVKCSFLNVKSIAWILWRICAKLLQHDVFLDYIFKKYHVQIFSHKQYYDRVSSVKQIAWIPDFQHKYLPELFSDDELKQRDKVFYALAACSNGVILSSQDAKKDFCKYYPQFAGKAKVLSFVVPEEQKIMHIDTLLMPCLSLIHI